jgi:hypothetical protein
VEADMSAKQLTVFQMAKEKNFIQMEITIEVALKMDTKMEREFILSLILKYILESFKGI